MKEKFAYFEYYKSYKDIPVPFHLAKRIQQKHLLSIQRPELSKISLLNAEGYKVTLPLTKKDLKKTNQLGSYMNQTLSTLKSMGVSKIMPCYEFGEFETPMETADKSRIFSFLLLPAIKKILKILNKDIYRTELIIIDHETQDTEFILMNLSAHLNFISVLTEKKELLKEICDRISFDSGLPIHLTDNNNSPFIRSADVVINLKPSEDYFSYKRGAVYFNLCPFPSKIPQKRCDIIVVDSLGIKSDKNFFPMDVLEMALSISNSDYQLIKSGHFSPANVEKLQKDLTANQIKIASFMQNEKEIPMKSMLELKS